MQCYQPEGDAPLVFLSKSACCIHTRIYEKKKVTVWHCQKAIIISKTFLYTNRGFTCTGYLCININSDVLKYIFFKTWLLQSKHATESR